MDKPRKKRPYTLAELRAEVLRLSGHDHDPCYLVNIRNGNRRSVTLAPIIAQAEKNLSKRSAAA